MCHSHLFLLYFEFGFNFTSHYRVENDIQLIRRIKENDEDAFDSLFRRYYKYLVVVAYQYIKDDHKAKDIVQDVFHDLWKRRSGLEIVNTKAFLRRAAINGCLANMRKGKRISFDTDEVNSDGSSKNYVEEEINFNELNQVVRKIVDLLPERCREIFELSRFEQLSHKEIAQRLDISVKTIENQMTKALKIFRSQLKEQGLLGIVILILLFT